MIDIANLLDSNEMIGKLLVSDDSEFLNTDECNDTDFIQQENDALLLDINYNSGVGDSAYVSASNFLWDGVDSYVG